MANIKFIAIILFLMLASASLLESYRVSSDSYEEISEQSDSSNIIEKRDMFKRNCVCRTFLSSRNSKNKGKLRKYCTCLNKN
ncbi:unnamed protein product [Brachionus calyciflorus]|uniref:Uncharacterized protein n=1 Tax=Brachionus calyciflorus TaxID=104777 RepID=A0A813QTE9_9BILA|nr:unnamed protein product [Brachionus calyciflorus]